jgi:hypothetical protein
MYLPVEAAEADEGGVGRVGSAALPYATHPTLLQERLLERSTLISQSKDFFARFGQFRV